MSKKTKDQEVHGAGATKTGTEIDIDKIDLDRMKTQTSENPGLVEYGTDRGAVSFEPTKKGAIKSRAFKIMDEQIDMQMKNIMEQIQVLAKQVENLKARKKVSEIIYQANMSFEPLSGRDYYLYQTQEGSSLSMLSPKEFGEKKLKKQNWEFIAHVRLLADATWEIVEKSELWNPNI